MATTHGRRVAGSLSPAWVGGSTKVACGRIARLYVPKLQQLDKGYPNLIFPYGEEPTDQHLTGMGLGGSLKFSDLYDPPRLIIPIQPFSQVGDATTAGIGMNQDVDAFTGYPGRSVQGDGDKRTYGSLNKQSVEWLEEGDIVVKCNSGFRVGDQVYYLTADVAAPTDPARSGYEAGKAGQFTAVAGIGVATSLGPAAQFLETGPRGQNGGLVSMRFENLKQIAAVTTSGDVTQAEFDTLQNRVKALEDENATG